MSNSSLTWFFATFSNEFRQGKEQAFEFIMFVSLCHFFGFYNPKQVADFLGIAHQHFYRQLKSWSVFQLKRLLITFMVKQAAESLKAILQKSDATKSRAAITISVDNSVIDRLGRLLRCTWSWYSGRAKKVVNGQDLLGIVLTINSVVFPLHLLFVSKQGRANTDKPTLLIAMLEQLIQAFKTEGIDITAFAITMDSWYASDELKQQLYELGFKKIIIAGKGNYVFTIEGNKEKASQWKKTLKLLENQWGIDVPSFRIKATSPTFGKIVLFFYQKNTTRNYYLMDLSKNHLRGAEIWHIWKQHFFIECFWKSLKSTLKIKQMQLQGDGLYTGLLIKVLAYLLAIRLKSTSNLSITQIMRKIRRENDLKKIIIEHFHFPDSLTKEITSA